MTANGQAAVIGIFRDRTLAEQAIDELRQMGWSNDQVHIAGQRVGGLLASLKSAFAAPSGSDELTLNDPLFQNLSDEQGKQYQHAFEQGSVIVAIDAANRPLEVRDTLHRFGAMNVLLPSSQGDARIIPLRREDIDVQKNTTVVGELRIHKRIITENKTFTVPVTREEVTIERLPFSSDTAQASTQAGAIAEQSASAQESPSVQPAPLTGQPILQTTAIGSSVSSSQQLNPQATTLAAVHEVLENGGSLRILVHEEQVIIQKQTVVVEEILVHKQNLEETRHLSVPVRHEEVYFERHGNVEVHSDRTDDRIETVSSIPPG